MQTFDMRPVHLEDALVKMIPLEPVHYSQLFEAASDPLIWEQHPTKDRYKKEVFQLFFDGAIQSNSSFIVLDVQTGEIIGSSRFYDLKPDHSSIAIGYSFLTRKYWGGQYNTAVKTLLINYAFQYTDTIFFHVGATNFRSQKAVLKLGAVKVNEVDFDYYGGKLLHYEYRLLKQDWEPGL